MQTPLIEESAVSKFFKRYGTRYEVATGPNKRRPIDRTLVPPELLKRDCSFKPQKIMAALPVKRKKRVGGHTIITRWRDGTDLEQFKKMRLEDFK